MSAHTLKCKSCGGTVSCEMYHLGFSEMQALYCSSCSKVLLLHDFTLFERNGIHCPPLEASAPAFKPYTRHILPFFQQAEALFKPCPCGGSFRFMNPPRCPLCKGLLLGDCYEDKPIFKLRDWYVFICSGSISAEEHLLKMLPNTALEPTPTAP